MTKKEGRIACEVPFCRRTAPAARYEAGTRIICGKHWRLGDERPRRVYRRALRKHRMTGESRFSAIANRCWERVLRQATERAVGITG